MPELKIHQEVRTDEHGYASFETKANPVYGVLRIPNFTESPFQNDSDTISDEIGFRTIETRGIEFYSMARKYSVEGMQFTKKPHTAMEGHIRR